MEGQRSPDSRPPVRAAEAVEGASVLDGAGKAIGEAFRGAIGPGKLKDALSGTWIGHALHPLLTDVVIGSFVSATLLDVLGGDRDGKAAERLIAIGIASYPPTALTGVSDWADSEIADPAVRRVGLVHAATNSAALGLYAASLLARRRGDAGRGKALGLAGAGALATAGYLGAHLTFVRGVGPNQTAFDPGPDEWTDAIESSRLPANEPRSALVGETPVFLLRHADGVHAMHDRCSHRGCPLSDGEIDGEVVVCYCHGSRFRLEDGSIELGPATVPQPSFEARESDGQVQVRLPPAPAG